MMGHAIPLHRSPNRHAGRLDPDKVECIVIHYTAGRSFAGDLRWLLNPDARASAHLLIGRTAGEGMVRLVDWMDVAWHAGDSEWQGSQHVNGFSVGIELCNFGYASDRDSYGRYYRVQGQHRIYYPDASPPPIHHGGNYWEPYSDWQYEALAYAIRSEIMPMFPRLSPNRRRIVGHSEVSPGRKLDPGPAFDWERLMVQIWEGSCLTTENS